MTVAARQHIPPFEASHLEGIAKVLGDTNDGLTGSEIGHFLGQKGVQDPGSGVTKWKRLHDAFADFQNRHQSGHLVVWLVGAAMNPARFTDDPTRFERLRDRLNTVLLMCGIELRADGTVRSTTQAQTLSEALLRVDRIRGELLRRGTHNETLRYCTQELMERNVFHAVLEAVKGIAARIRSLSGLTADGSDLIDQAFSAGKSGRPLLRVNAGDTETLQGEQRGFVNLLKGVFGMFRNPTAHAPRIEWPMCEDDALDMLTVVSLIHRKLDRAVKT